MRKLFLLLTLCLCTLTCVSFAKEQKTKTVVDITETITVAEMDARLANTPADALYMKIGDDEVFVYNGIAKSRSLRKQIILTAPNSNMLKLYTNDKETFRQMSKMLQNYEEDGKSFDGYRVITDVDNEKVLSDKITVYRFWFMKVEKGKNSGGRYPIGIGRGIGGGLLHGPWFWVGLSKSYIKCTKVKKTMFHVKHCLFDF